MMPGPVGQRLDPFRHDVLAALGRCGGAARLKAVVDEHVRYDVAGERIVGAVDRPFDDRPERVEIAGRLAQPDAIGSDPFGVVVLHLPFLRACFRAKRTIHWTGGSRQQSVRAARRSFRRRASDRGGSVRSSLRPCCSSTVAAETPASTGGKHRPAAGKLDPMRARQMKSVEADHEEKIEHHLAAADGDAAARRQHPGRYFFPGRAPRVPPPTVRALLEPRRLTRDDKTRAPVDVRFEFVAATREYDKVRKLLRALVKLPVLLGCAGKPASARRRRRSCRRPRRWRNP